MAARLSEDGGESDDGKEVASVHKLGSHMMLKDALVQAVRLAEDCGAN